MIQLSNQIFTNLYSDARTIRAVFNTSIKVFTIQAGQEYTCTYTCTDQVKSFIEIPATNNSNDNEKLLKILDGDGEIDKYLFKDDTLLCITKRLSPSLIAISFKDKHVSGYDLYLHTYNLISDRITYYVNPHLDLKNLLIIDSLENNPVFYTSKLFALGYMPFAKKSDNFVITKPFLRISRVFVKKIQLPVKKTVFTYNKYKGNNLYFLDEHNIEHCLASKDSLDAILRNIEKGKICIKEYYKITLESNSFVPEYMYDFNNLEFTGLINAEVCSDSD